MLLDPRSAKFPVEIFRTAVSSVTESLSFISKQYIKFS